MKNKGNRKNINGWLCIDKAQGLTSARVVSKIKYITNAQKVGHAGTLDPLATGILPIALGEATKTSEYIMGKGKTYLFTLKFGSSTDSYDLDGKTIHEGGRIPLESEIINALPQFIGLVEQIPPQFSAIKVDGKRAYKLAREGKNVEIKARNVQIYSLSLITQASAAEFSFKISCGKGTYIRAIARDLSEKLGTYGHLTNLRRTNVGKFSEDNAISLDKLEQLVHNGALFEKLLPVDTALDDIPVVEMDSDDSSRVRNGISVSTSHLADSEKAYARFDNKVVALGTIKEAIFKPNRVFNY